MNILKWFAKKPEDYDKADYIGVLLDSVESDYLFGKIDRETYLALLDQIDELIDRCEHGKPSKFI